MKKIYVGYKRNSPLAMEMGGFKWNYLRYLNLTKMSGIFAANGQSITGIFGHTIVWL